MAAVPRFNRSNACVVFGHPSKHQGLNLPTHQDVMKHYLFVRQELKTSNKEPTFSDISDCVVHHVQSMWEKASIPTLSRKRI